MVFCVNYSSYNYLLTFMESVERASAKTKRVTNVCEDSCNALQGRLQCFASEMGKTGTEIVSPILDDYRLLNFIEHTKILRADSICRSLPYIIIMA